jgi:hypothetical protein
LFFLVDSFVGAYTTPPCGNGNSVDPVSHASVAQGSALGVSWTHNSNYGSSSTISIRMATAARQPNLNASPLLSVVGGGTSVDIAQGVSMKKNRILKKKKTAARISDSPADSHLNVFTFICLLEWLISNSGSHYAGLVYSDVVFAGSCAVLLHRYHCCLKRTDATDTTANSSTHTIADTATNSSTYA